MLIVIDIRIKNMYFIEQDFDIPFYIAYTLKRMELQVKTIRTQ